MIKPFKPQIAKYQTKGGGQGNMTPHANPNLKGASVCSKAVSGLGASTYTTAGYKGKTIAKRLSK